MSDYVLITNVVVAMVALYGAVLSSYTLLTQRRDKKPKIKVSFSRGFIGNSIYLSAPKFIFEAINTGQVPVYLSSAGYLLPKKFGEERLTAFFTGPDPDASSHWFPHTLEPGNSFTAYRDADEIINALKGRGYTEKVAIQPFYKDRAGNTYMGKKIHLKL